MSGGLFRAIEDYSQAAGKALAPQWAGELDERDCPLGAEALDTICQQLDWPIAKRVAGRPRADQFPLLVYDPQRGWACALQWAGEDSLFLAGTSEPLEWHDELACFILSLPDPLAEKETRAIDVFWRAIRRRKRVLVIAGLATVIANILTLATSLYAMQLYDRVIPLASFETLLVLTLGVVFALGLDLVLRGLRAWLIELEAQDIDKEVSEYFFSRAQSIRLDARPQGVGTLAAQIQGQDQIRQVMSSTSIFILADLPFALFFVFVIAMIGGSLAIVPIVSLPIAIAIAILLARMIRSGADRAQLSSNQKNGLLVEMLDASETVKANQGGWQLLKRWNRLIRDIHHFERPVKRVSAISGSLFSTLQQTAYVALMGFGAVLAAQGEITTGALLACSIIAGRINGPLIAQLPNLIVQWSYARSSLKALDSLMELPVEQSVSRGGLRPGDLRGEIRIADCGFAYPGGKPAVAIERLAIKPGERLAIIGAVGSGKSTLLRLIAGLYSPQAGTITIGGLDLGQIAEEVARRHIGYLGQHARLVRGSLRENLTMGLGQIGDDELIELARTTRLDAVISQHEAGLEMPIQEGGIGLSGGQRALVGLNRLIHAKPGIWVLDEPTSALDLMSEAAAFAAIEKAVGRDDILIMATHRMQLLERFTRVVILAGGQVVKDGPAAEILKEIRQQAPRSAPSRTDPRHAPHGNVTTRVKTGDKA